MINKFIFLLQESLRSLIRTKIPTMVSSLAIAVSLFIISVTYCLYISFQDLTLEFKDRYSIEVFFDENISEKQAISEFNSILSSTDQIEEGVFIDKADAANIFKTQFIWNVVVYIEGIPISSPVFNFIFPCPVMSLPFTVV